MHKILQMKPEHLWATLPFKAQCHAPVNQSFVLLLWSGMNCEAPPRRTKTRMQSQLQLQPMAIFLSTNNQSPWSPPSTLIPGWKNTWWWLATDKGFLVAEEQEEFLRIYCLWPSGWVETKSFDHPPIWKSEILCPRMMMRNYTFYYSVGLLESFILQGNPWSFGANVVWRTWMCLSSSGSPLSTILRPPNQQVSLGLVNAATPSGADFTRSVLFALANSNRKLSSAS